MRDSSACLMRSFSQLSPTSSDEKKRNSLQRALTTSVSFGRFMSESLDWEKWSAFTHNRYLEEVEKYSKPGSVAEKKAYFEAHFKRRRAAALLEQQNASANDISENSTDIKDKDNFTSTIQNTKREEVHNNNPVFHVDQNYPNDFSTENKTSEECQPEGENKEVIEPSVPTEIAVEITKHLENAECNGDILSREDNNSWHEDGDSSKRNLASLIVKKSEVSSSILSTNSGGVSECAPSVKKIMHTQTRTSVKTPDKKKKAVESSNKRRSRMTSLHMSINFDSCSQKATFPGPPNITENPRLLRAPIKKYKNSTVVPQALTRASVRGVFKHLSTAPPVEHRRTVTAQGDSSSARRTVDLKVQSSSPKFSKSSNSFEEKARLPTTSSPFKFKSEERAAKHKEFFQKLEEKLKIKEVEKHDQAKSQVNSRSNFKDLRISIVSKAIENVEPSPRIKLPPCYLKKMVPTERLRLPRVEEMASFKVEDKDSRPPWRLPVKTLGLNVVAGKNLRHPSGKCSMKKTNENASPNIWRV